MSTRKLDFNAILKEGGLKIDDPEAGPILKETNRLNQIISILAMLGLTPQKLIEAILKKLGKGSGTTSTPVAPSAPAAPTPTVPAPPPSPEPPTVGRIIGALVPKFFWYQETAGSPVVSREQFNAIINRSDPMVPRSRMAVDCDTIDQFGKEIRPEHWTEEMKLNLLWYPKDHADPEKRDTQRIRWFFDGGDDIADINESGDGTVPKIKIGKDALPEDNRDYETGRLFCRYEAPDGRVIESIRLPSLRAKR